MNDQDKLEKVIRGLKMSYTYSNVDEDNTLVPQQLVLDALALLKAQEPRVMMLEEVLALPYDTPIYVENCDGPNGWDVYAGITKDADHDVVTGAQWATCEYWPQNEYGKTWRCWTSRPDEQREAVKWDG